MESTNLPAEQAMSMLKITESKHKKYQALLKQQSILHGIEEAILFPTRNLMDSAGLSAEQAMALLQIP